MTKVEVESIYGMPIVLGEMNSISSGKCASLRVGIGSDVLLTKDSAKKLRDGLDEIIKAKEVTVRRSYTKSAFKVMIDGIKVASFYFNSERSEKMAEINANHLKKAIKMGQ